MKMATAVYASSVLFMLVVSAGTPAYASGGQTRTPIRHLINIYFENHTFDNFFGVYPQDPSSPDRGTIADLSSPVNLLSNGSLLDELKPVAPGAFSTPDPVEGYTAYHIDWNGGSMDRFVEGSGPYSMTYYTAAQLGPIWDLAEEYSLGDMYFAPVLSESAPNTMYYLAGYSPVINDYGPPPSIPFSQTVLGELDSYGVSWGIFVPYQNQSATYSEWAQISGMNGHLEDVHSWSSFVSDLAAGNVPAVSWVFSQEANGTDQAAPSNILKGEMWLLYMINEIEQSPVWDSTAVTITWDDPGGYYDQVPPPVVGGVQAGFRLPLIVVSPYAKENYVSDTVLTHASTLAFIDYNWQLPALNRYVSDSNVPLDLFDFASAGGSGVPRKSLVFSFGAGLPLPTEPYFDLPNNLGTLNLSDTFPMPLQYGASGPPPSGHGSANMTLSSLGPGVYVSENSTLMPFYASTYPLALLVAATAVVLFWGARTRKRGGG